MFESLRQLAYPNVFRIKPPAWTGDMAELIEKTAAKIMASQPISTANIGNKDLYKFLSDMGTGLWRIRKSIVPEDGGEPAAENRRVYRHLESIWDSLSDKGVEIRNHTGETIVGGEALKIIAFQPTPGLLRDQVIETLRPTIYYKGNMIQTGEVIVGQPE